MLPGEMAHVLRFSWAVLVALALYQVGDAATTQSRAVPTSRGAPSMPVVDPAFANAGKTAGIEIWRIESLKPVAYPKADYGKFYSGDSYIVLSTKEKNGVFSWDIHFWLGIETTQDESTAAAILTAFLDNQQFGGDPVQHREVQEHESPLFHSYFKSGIRYLPGGVASGFTHVDPNAVEKRLFHVKGKRNIRVKQVSLSISSMNKGDCFILDAGNDIYVYVGVKSKRTERLKAVQAANLIRDQDHAGRARIHVIDETATESEVETFFNVLGGGSASAVPDESAGGDDQQFEASQEQSATLYRVSDASGKMQVQAVSQKPIRQNQLDTGDCFILDTLDANLYVWIGKQCNKKERDEALQKGQGYLTSKHYPSWTHVVRVVEGGEPSGFTQYFQAWQAVGELHPRLVRSAAAKPTPLAEKSGGEVPEFMPDNGSGEIEIFRVENFELQPVDKDNYGKFFGGDSYVIKYHATNGKWIIYVWQGVSSSLDEKAASAIHAVQLDNDLGGRAIQIRVVQDNEPKHFLHIFKGKLITFLGGHASGFKNIKDHDTYVQGETRVFRVRGTSPDDVRASQQPASAKSLESDDVFIVENDNNAWIWIGEDSDEIERNLANGFVEHISPGVAAVVIKEGEEPAEFWDALGGKAPYHKHFKATKQHVSEAKLFHVHLHSSGKVNYEQIYDFDQTDLDEDDVMVLDSLEEIFVWVGKGATADEEKATLKKLEELLKKHHRQDAVVLVIKQGEEPEMFTAMFPSWDHEHSGASHYEVVKQKLADHNKSI